MTKSNSKRGKRGAKNRRNNSNSARMVIPHPMPVRGIEIIHATTLRYRVIAAAVAEGITFQNLLDTILVASTAVLGYDLFQAVRIRAVRVYGIAAIGTASSVSLEFAGIVAGLVGDHQIITDSSMGVQPAFVQGRPSVRTLAGDWQLSSANVAFFINCPAGSVVDVDLSLRGPTYGVSGPAPVAAQNALVAATVGAQYVRGLDGQALATSNWVPEFTNGQI